MKTGMIVMACMAVLGVSVLFAADVADTDLDQPESQPSTSEADLVVRHPITLGAEEVRLEYHAAVPGFALYGVEILERKKAWLVMVGVSFTKHEIEKARVLVEFLDKKGEVLHAKEHTEARGPDEVILKGPSRNRIQKWNSYRDIWLDFPNEIRDVSYMRVSVFLTRDNS